MSSLGVKFRGPWAGSDEDCFYTLIREGRRHIASFFRAPADHVLSMYLEYRHSNWGKTVTQNTTFPRDPEQDFTTGHVPAFEAWLDHFLHGCG